MTWAPADPQSVRERCVTLTPSLRPPSSSTPTSVCCRGVIKSADDAAVRYISPWKRDNEVQRDARDRRRSVATSYLRVRRGKPLLEFT